MHIPRSGYNEPQIARLIGGNESKVAPVLGLGHFCFPECSVANFSIRMTNAATEIANIKA
ncbi:hypothetical protein CEB3_c05170 [Peptococcaceae bacterium CEB3]|nr:hypothetical protein CEB3_c05170 [Peptococcaceae bacterium CEB3]